MQRIITVQFGDGSGWQFTRPISGDLWTLRDIHGGIVDDVSGIVANDHRKALIDSAIALGSNVTITVAETY